MRSKAPLILMEQMVMLLVFALASALCLQAFVKSDDLSARSEARDRAVTAAQTAAETIRHNAGDMEQAAAALGAAQYDESSLLVAYDSDWDIAQDTMRYHLGAVLVDSGVDGLGTAQIWVRDEGAEEDESELLRFEVSWQEEVSSIG